MYPINNSLHLICMILLLMPFQGCGQIQTANDSTTNKIEEAAREIMTSAKTCALITLDQDGRPRARAMDPFLPEGDFTVWFGTNPKSRKVDQIKQDARVTLYYLADSGDGYVMLHGLAQIVNDPKEKEKRWKDEWEAFYPDKMEHYALIKVIPQWLEVISEAYGVFGDPATWKPPVLLFDAH